MLPVGFSQIMYKRFFSILFLITVICSLCACGAANTEEPVGTVEITSYYDGLDLSEYIDPVEYKCIAFSPSTDTGRDYIVEGDSVTAKITLEIEGQEEPVAGINTFSVGQSFFINDHFDEYLIGAHVNDVLEFDTQFAEDFGEDALAGKNVHVTAEILIVDLSYWRNLDRTQVFDIAVANAVVKKYPEDVVAMYANSFEENYRAFAKEYDMELSDYTEFFFNFTEEEMDDVCRRDAELAVKEDMVIYSVLDREGLAITQTDLDNAKASWMETYRIESEEDVDWEDESVYNSLLSLAVSLKVKNFLLANAVATGK